MAKEYIERDAALMGVMRAGCMANTVQVLKDIPAADVVEVVRCKDCRRSRPLRRHDRLENRYGDGCVWCMEHSDGMRDDDFCSDGERRDDNAAD